MGEAVTRSYHSIDGSAAIVFGDHAQYIENITPSDTSSAVFTEYLSLVTPVIEAGTYRIGWVFQYEASTATTEGEYRLEIDNTTNVDTETLIIASANERKSYANISFEALAAGSHTIDLDFRRSGGPGIFTIDDAKIEIWRAI